MWFIFNIRREGDMGMNITEKIIAAHAGLDHVEVGQIVTVKADVLLVSEFPATMAIESFRKIRGADRLVDPQKTVVVLDHNVPNRDISSANVVKRVREFSIDQGVLFYEVGHGGIEHVLLPEQGIVRPGMLVAGADSHTCTYGGLALVSIGVGSTDVGVAWATGELWLKVPPAIRVEIKGGLKKWVSGKDIILKLVGIIGVDGGNYHTIEFCGEGVSQLNMTDRLTICNMVIESGAKNGIFPFDGVTEKFAKSVTDKPFEKYASDPDAKYVRDIVLDLDKIEPQVACPSLPSNVKPVAEVESGPLDQVVIGACTNGRIEDLRVAAEVMRGKKLHPRTRCIIIPGSQKVLLDAIKEGLIEVFINAGCIISPPTCGPCIGGHMGVLAQGERCVATTNRNFLGRMGDVTSELYLANPAVSAASAIRGSLTLPE
jgi:3-isopropylmalate/(R)-2-methylmalate dehydratase large subunit